MPTVRQGDIQFEIDELGFMQNPGVWNEEVAKALATSEGVDELTDDHWKLIKYIRAYYLRFDSAPLIRKLCLETGFKLARVYELFPSGPALGLCKVAGMAKPTGCV
ncbi:MAG: TusE/DsrC/DsvC family sulfur relay protein [candidate division Zixibacteria bacterium]|nr:TusE/DsrC/DsvC family sulfur relay protein [candidate division Zixibacteria bacterium]MDH3936015.1 TusE/DsrC/DsvC family sulfur relay protein [candidate division Zixibacteria bacterium]